MACGAESRTAERYATFVEEAKVHAQSISPLISLQFALIVRHMTLALVDLQTQ